MNGSLSTIITIFFALLAIILIISIIYKYKSKKTIQSDQIINSKQTPVKITKEQRENNIVDQEKIFALIHSALTSHIKDKNSHLLYVSQLEWSHKIIRVLSPNDDSGLIINPGDCLYKAFDNNCKFINPEKMQTGKTYVFYGLEGGSYPLHKGNKLPNHLVSYRLIKKDDQNMDVILSDSLCNLGYTNDIIESINLYNNQQNRQININISIEENKNIAKQKDDFECGYFSIYNQNQYFFHNLGVNHNDITNDDENSYNKFLHQTMIIQSIFDYIKNNLIVEIKRKNKNENFTDDIDYCKDENSREMINNFLKDLLEIYNKGEVEKNEVTGIIQKFRMQFLQHHGIYNLQLASAVHRRMENTI